jgi:voltage-gated potassium channel
MNNAKARVHQILDRPEEGDTASKVVNGLLMALIALNVIVAILRTVQSFDDRFGHHLYYFDRASIAVFSIEYLLRVWSCTVDDKYQQPLSGRIRYMFSPPALVDLFAIAPYYLALDLRYLRVFRLFLLLKLGRYASRLRLIRNVLVAKKEELIISMSLALVALIFCSAAMYYVEKDQQPEAFSSIPSSMWWAIETLSTVGYGDVIPVTATGKFLGGLIALIGIGLFALPAGILAGGFSEELARPKKKRQCPHCGKAI